MLLHLLLLPMLLHLLHLLLLPMLLHLLRYALLLLLLQILLLLLPSNSPANSSAVKKTDLRVGFFCPGIRRGAENSVACNIQGWRYSRNRRTASCKLGSEVV